MNYLNQKKKIERAKTIAHAELFNPTIIGDVEEILYQMFMLESKAVKGINNMEIFDSKTFAIKKYGKDLEDNLEQYQGAHIAIVEDSKIDQRIIKHILNIDGVTLFCMRNGAEMLELLEKEEIDIIFSDINMPVMDGLTMTRHIRKKKKWNNIPIVSISSMAFTHELREMQLAGMNASIAKPITTEEVYRALKRFLVVTPEIRTQRLLSTQVKFDFNTNILDIDKGLKEAENELLYREILKETMDMLEETLEVFSKMVYAQEYRALEEFCQSTLPLYENIHAGEMIKLLTELLQFISMGQKIYLIEYDFLYQKNWKKLQNEIEKYLTQNKR
ncbi:MAG: response regulator [Sulfurovum sp.]|nr:response regulator [Sulfurovum sp.]